jgi:PIN domain nuclease of toxin-antitoxin system
VNLLLDTHLLLWAASEPERLSKKARQLLLDAENQLHFSSASVWEIAIKRALGRQDFQVDIRRFWRLLLVNGYHELKVSGEHAVALESLPSLHKDPFDRLLIAQATVEGHTLITRDRQVAAYRGSVKLV